ncbi:MAG: galactitol-1-phosphate 5-dehydrogenase [Sporolactobacillus sp.]
MKALIEKSKANFILDEIEKPAIAIDQIIVKVSYCGICGSDLPRYFEGAVHQFPQILGHEFSGIVDQVGAHTNGINPGDRVAVAPLVPCGKCENCKKGFPALCTQYSFVGSREDGAMAEYVSVPSQNILKLPHKVSLKEAALIEPLTVAIHGVDRVDVHAGARVLIFGAGTIGLMTLLTLKAKGAGPILVVDINQNKLDLSLKLGADEIINPMKSNLREYFKENERPEYIYETAGSAVTQVQAIDTVKKKGKVVFIGTAKKNVSYPPETFEKILRGELEVTGSWMSYSSPFPGYEWNAGLHYIEEGKIDVKPLISGIYHLEDKEKPFIDMVEKNTDRIKLLYKIE